MSLATGLALAVAATAAPLLAPSGAWSVGQSDSSCMLERTFGEGDSGVMLTLRPSPLGSTYMVVLSARDEHDGRTWTGTARMWPSPGAKPIEAAYLSTRWSGDDRRRTSFHVQDSPLGALAGSQRLAIDAGEAGAASLHLGEMRPALDALDDCQSELRRAWGLDPEAVAAIATPAVPAEPEAVWISHRDYPEEALKAGLEGTSVIVWTIGTNGRVSDCRAVVSSGHAVLDAAACNAISKRGRYRPARDRSGKRTKSWASRRVMWSPPSSF